MANDLTEEMRKTQLYQELLAEQEAARAAMHCEKPQLVVNNGVTNYVSDIHRLKNSLRKSNL